MFPLGLSWHPWSCSELDIRISVSAAGKGRYTMRPSLALLGRSTWKGPFFTAFPNLADAAKTGTPIYTRARACTVVPNFVGIKFMVHNGMNYVPVSITEDMVGYKLGEFAVTRRRFTYRASRNR